MITITEAGQLENALVTQKDDCLSKINSAQDSDGMMAALRAVELVGIVWNAVGYGYKFSELLIRIVHKCDDMIRDEEEYLRPLRKNDSTRKSTEAEIRNLKHIAECAKR